MCGSSEHIISIIVIIMIIVIVIIIIVIIIIILTNELGIVLFYNLRLRRRTPEISTITPT